MKKRKTDSSSLGVLLLDVKQVAELLNIGVSTVWALVKEGRFPEPIRLTSRCSRWKRSDVVAWSKTLSNENEAAV
ncbi:helix-turn-helix transcriptional regulator [Parasutterella excrementihominis]|jgi:prophage regulatory protein|uniref:helix-turn-helix transcriptional regulator n=1 Tax=Parasutterella excrementihominis TaxID=487175 RepID=UPI003AF04F57